MSSNELNAYFRRFEKPTDVSAEAWRAVLEQSKKVWQAYLSGQSWKEKLEITCKESYLMLVNEKGQLIVTDESLLHYAQNQQIYRWCQHLERLAIRSLREQDFNRAERFFTKALKVDRTNATNYYRRAMVRSRLGKYRDAVNDLDQSIRLQPRNAHFYIKRAEIYRLLDIDYKAMGDLNTAIRLDPSNPEAFEIRGRFRIAIGDKVGGRCDLATAKKLRAETRNNDSFEAAA
ncbi:MAG: hypothetical protein Kow0075_05880 [Salibacteraceae bacterium]